MTCILGPLLMILRFNREQRICSSPENTNINNLILFFYSNEGIFCAVGVVGQGVPWYIKNSVLIDYMF